MISVIILTWNSSQHIGSCLGSLFAEVKRSNREVKVLVTDNGSTDGTREILEEYENRYPQLGTTFLDKNMGTTVPRNRGVEKSNGRFLLFLDSDTEIKPGLLDVLPKTLTSNKEIGMLGPRLLNPDGTVQASCKKFPTLQIKVSKFSPVEFLVNWGRNKELYDPAVYKKEFEELIEVDHCISATWMMRREVFEEVGGLDEKIFYAPEDVDFCLRTWLEGYRVGYQPKAEVVHQAQRIGYDKLSLSLKHLQGLVYYFRKYNYLFSREKIYEKIKTENEDFRKTPMLV